MAKPPPPPHPPLKLRKKRRRKEEDGREGEYQLPDGSGGENSNFSTAAVDKRRHFQKRPSAPSPPVVPTPKIAPNNHHKHQQHRPSPAPTPANDRRTRQPALRCLKQHRRDAIAPSPPAPWRSSTAAGRQHHRLRPKMMLSAQRQRQSPPSALVQR